MPILIQQLNNNYIGRSGTTYLLLLFFFKSKDNLNNNDAFELHKKDMNKSYPRIPL